MSWFRKLGPSTIVAPAVRPPSAPPPRPRTEVDKIAGVVQAICLHSSHGPGMPLARGFVSGLRVIDLSAEGREFSPGLQNALGSDRTDEVLNARLVAAGSDMRVFIRKPMGPVVVERLKTIQVDLFILLFLFIYSSTKSTISLKIRKLLCFLPNKGYLSKNGIIISFKFFIVLTSYL